MNTYPHNYGADHGRSAGAYDRRALRLHREAQRKAFRGRLVKLTAVPVAVVAALALTGAALAFVLGGFQSGTGSVDKFDAQLSAASTQWIESNDPVNFASGSITADGALTLSTVYDSYAGVVRVEIANGSSEPLKITDIIAQTNAAPGAIAFTHEQGVCEVINPGGPAVVVRFGVEILDTSLLAANEPIAWRVVAEESTASCSAPSVGDALTVEAL